MINSAEEFRRLRLFNDPAEYGRAAYERAPDSVWLEVIDRHPDLREWVAHNKTVPLLILRVLATDDDAKVRLFVAAKRKLDLPLFELLAEDPDEGVRHRIACNAKTPHGVRLKLTNDPAAFVAESARERLSNAR